MERIINALNEVHSINDVYNISNEKINNTLLDIDKEKVCIPIIGKFSSGKSALVNTILGYSKKILKEDITPETAVPTEIIYNLTEDNVVLYDTKGNTEKLDINSYRNMSIDANTITHITVNLKNSFLEEIPDVMIVDMPGFESGFEIHNKAIDNYLPKSLAYIITFPADDMIVRSSVGTILKELCLHDMPICIVITKYDKKDDSFDDTLNNLKENLKKFIGDRPIKYCFTSSFTGDADELKNFLIDIQGQSQNILSNKFKNIVNSIIDNTENYLKTTLKNSEMSESELSEEEDKLNKQLNNLTVKFSKEKENFQIAIQDCKENINRDIENALRAEESTLVAMAMNNQSISEHINTLVRRTVTTSIKKNLVPKIEKYIKKVEKCISGESIGDIHISFNVDIKEMDKGITASIVAITAGILMGIPILGAIAAGILALVNKSNAEQKRAEMKNQIRSRLNSEVYPQVLREVSHGIDTAITKQIVSINNSIDEEITNQKETLEKAMADVRSKLNEEKTKKETLLVNINNDLKRIGEIRNEL